VQTILLRKESKAPAELGSDESYAISAFVGNWGVVKF